MEKDNRFNNIRNKLSSFFGFWIMQGISVPLILLPYIIFNTIASPEMNLIFNIGILIAIIGFVLETVADHQKYNFKLSNPTQFMDKGVWEKLRHPNYTGEILFWSGIFLACISNLNMNLSLIALSSPVWIVILLIKFSGIPPLEKIWKEKYGANPEYQRYCENSYRLIPYLY